MKKNKKISFKEVAYQILKSAAEPLSAKEIVEHATEAGILTTEGQTPEATMAAQLYVDINKNKETKFKKVGKGKFSLIEQTESSTSPLFLIDKQNNLVKKALMQKLYEMDPFQFEFLIADLLQEIGYEKVEVTKRSGDKGIDVTANLTMDGITDVKTVIQAKRFKKGNNIPGKIITQLRGSAEVDQRGLVITTSDFTKDAQEEAKAPNKMPVSLVNGEKLLSLLIKHGVGVKIEPIPIYSLDNEYFENEEEPTGKISHSGKNKSIWPLPGGTTVYVETLIKYLEAVTRGTNTQDKVITWFKQNFENVKSDNTASGYSRVPRAMGLTFVQNGITKLTADGEQVLKTKNLEVLYDVISKNVLAFSDIVEYLKISGEPQSEQDILRYIKENSDVDWETYAQVHFRLLWLINLGKIEKVEEGYVLSQLN